MKNLKIPRIALTVAEAAEAVGVSRGTVYRWTHMAGFPAFQVNGGCVRIFADDLKEWLKKQACHEGERGDAV